MSRSKWKIIEELKSNTPTYHSAGSFKTKGGKPARVDFDDASYFQSACIGQEFVFADSDPDELGTVANWVKRIIGATSSKGSLEK